MDVNILFDDEAFEDFLGSHENLLDALATLIEFKYTLTDQLANRREPLVGDWKFRITTLIIRVKARIRQVKGTLRIEGLGEEMQELVDDLREEREND